MKAIAADALIMQPARQREHRCDSRLRVVEGRVEAGDLRQGRVQPRHRLDRRYGMRLMQWRQGYELAQARDDLFVDQSGSGETASAMDHAVSCGAQMMCGEPLFEPLQQGGKRRLMRSRIAEMCVDQDALLCRGRMETRGMTDAVDRPLAKRLFVDGVLRHRVERELDAGRSRVENQEVAGHGLACVLRRASSRAIAQEPCRASALSARLVRMIGTRAPSTMPAVSASAKYSSCLASIFPASTSGTTKISARPATGETTPFVLAASSETAASKASGPSMTPPAICPRSAILQSAAASSVDLSFVETVSTAARIATFGAAMPSAWARSMAFCTMSRLSSRVG